MNILTHDTAGVATITLNKPKTRNALDPELMAQLNAAYDAYSRDPEIRVVVLTGAGDYFCAGADLHWMRSAQDQSPEQNHAEALALAQLLETISQMPMATVAFIQGPAFGGGVGLAAACDMIVASESAFFALSEVRLGLIPAIISPYVIRAWGEPTFRRYSLTGEQLSTQRAYELGLVHHIADSPQHVVEDLLAGGPEAQSTIKSLLNDVVDEEMQDVLAQVINNLRASEEAQEGIEAFFDKRRPLWAEQG